MSPRTIGAVCGYYENLVTPRALFAMRPEQCQGALRRTMEFRPTSSTQAQAAAQTRSARPAEPVPFRSRNRIRRASPPIRRSDRRPCRRLDPGWIRDRPPLPFKMGEQRPGASRNASRATPRRCRTLSAQPARPPEHRSHRAPRSPISGRASPRTRHRARLRIARRLNHKLPLWRGQLRNTDHLYDLVHTALNSDDLRVRSSPPSKRISPPTISTKRPTALRASSSSFTPIPTTARSVLWQLGALGNRGVEQKLVLAQLLHYVHDGSEVTRYWAVEGLALLGTDATVDPLLDRFAHDPSRPRPQTRRLQSRQDRHAHQRAARRRRPRTIEYVRRRRARFHHAQLGLRRPPPHHRRRTRQRLQRLAPMVGQPHHRPQKARPPQPTPLRLMHYLATPHRQYALEEHTPNAVHPHSRYRR